MSQEAVDGWDFDDAVEEGGGLFQGPGVIVVEVAVISWRSSSGMVEMLVGGMAL